MGLHTTTKCNSTLKSGNKKEGRQDGEKSSDDGRDDPDRSPQESGNEGRAPLRRVTVRSVEELTHLDPNVVQLALSNIATRDIRAQILREGRRRNFQFYQDQLYKQAALICILENDEAEKEKLDDNDFSEEEENDDYFSEEED